MAVADQEPTIQQTDGIYRLVNNRKVYSYKAIYEIADNNYKDLFETASQLVFLYLKLANDVNAFAEKPKVIISQGY